MCLSVVEANSKDTEKSRGETRTHQEKSTVEVRKRRLRVHDFCFLLLRRKEREGKGRGADEVKGELRRTMESRKSTAMLYLARTPAIHSLKEYNPRKHNHTY